MTAHLIVIASSIAAGVGGRTNHELDGLVGGVIASIVPWVLYAIAFDFIGTKIFMTLETWSTIGELPRVVGFAQVPVFLLILSGIYVPNGMVSVVVVFPILAITVIALREVLDFQPGAPPARRALPGSSPSFRMYC